MGQSIRATLLALLIFSSLACLMFWAVPASPSEHGIWWVRIVSLCICLVCLSLLIWSATFKDKAPDYLAKICPKYFERDGFCFGIGPEVEGNQARISFYYQNRYERPCEGIIWLVPTKVAFKDISGLPEFKVEIICAGGEFGKKSCVCGLPLRFKGEGILWDVAAQTKYPNGRGKLLRVRDGIRVGTEIRFAAFRQIIRFVGFFVSLHSEKPVRMKMKFRDEMFSFENISDWKQETIWKIGDRDPFSDSRQFVKFA
jgi:hypothetical protein